VNPQDCKKSVLAKAFAASLRRGKISMINITSLLLMPVNCLCDHDPTVVLG